MSWLNGPFEHRADGLPSLSGFARQSSIGDSVEEFAQIAAADVGRFARHHAAPARVSALLDLAGGAQSAGHASPDVFVDQPLDGEGLLVLVALRCFVGDQVAALARG